jgi:hypothetical protein
MTTSFGSKHDTTKAELAGTKLPAPKSGSGRHTRATGRTHVTFPPLHHRSSTHTAHGPLTVGAINANSRSSHPSPAHLVHKSIHPVTAREPKRRQ